MKTSAVECALLFLVVFALVGVVMVARRPVEVAAVVPTPNVDAMTPTPTPWWSHLTPAPTATPTPVPTATATPTSRPSTPTATEALPTDTPTPDIAATLALVTVEPMGTLIAPNGTPIAVGPPGGTVEPMATPEVFTGKKSGTINSDLVRLRSYPGFDGDVQMHLFKGTQVSIFGRSSDGKWLAVKVGNTEYTGWVYASYVTVK